MHEQSNKNVVAISVAATLPCFSTHAHTMCVSIEIAVSDWEGVNLPKFYLDEGTQ